jgi:hypothetical protein
MAQSLLLILKASIFESGKTLIINPEFMAFGTTSFSKFEITDLRYGVKPIYGYRFRIGRIYCIDIKSITGSIIRIRLKSLYRIRKNKLEKKYIAILNALFNNYMNDICRGFIDKFGDGIDFKIIDVAFNQEGIILNKNSEIICWDDLGERDYWTYYSLFSTANPNKYRTFHYLIDWNTIVLHTVSKHIIKSKNLL